MRDAHQVVVDDVGEVVSRQAVGLDQHAVVERVAVDFDVAVDHVVKAGLALGGHVLADDVRLARVKAALNLLLGEVEAVLVVLERLSPALGLGARLVQPLLRAKAIVGMAGLDQLFGIRQIEVAALGLHIGAAGAADIRAFVMREAGGGERLVDQLDRARHLALLIGVLDAQDELAAVAAREQIGVQRRAQVAQVHVSRRAGGEAGANFHVVKLL